MNDRPVRDKSLLVPLLISAISLLGIFSILALTWFPSPNPEVIATQTPTPFKYLFLATETSVPSLEPEMSTSSKFPSMPGTGSASRNVASSGQTVKSTDVNSLTPGVSIAVTIGPTAQFSERCAPPDTEFLDAIEHVVNSANPDNTLETAWVVQSTDKSDQWMELWFVAARIHGTDFDTESTPPAVWALLFYSEDYFDVYSINSSAIKYSDAALGEGNDPPITMQLDGGQTAYDCSVSRK